jgi:hypothetical protein
MVSVVLSRQIDDFNVVDIVDTSRMIHTSEGDVTRQVYSAVRLVLLLNWLYAVYDSLLSQFRDGEVSTTLSQAIIK